MHLFVHDAFDLFQRKPITREVNFHDEVELYVVDNELGLSGRFIRNLCNQVMKAPKLLLNMPPMRFADIQAIRHANDIVPDVSLGLVKNERTPDNVCLGGELTVLQYGTGHDLVISGIHSTKLSEDISSPSALIELTPFDKLLCALSMLVLPSLKVLRCSHLSH